LLPDDTVLGFQRYEIGSDGARNYSTIHSNFRWVPGSVRHLGGEVFAEHTNLHSACYLLSQAHLRRALASGGFLVPPRRGPYWSLMVSAATDVYLDCGLRRYICVSRIDDFLVHHLPNVYIGRLGVDEDEYRTQLAAIEGIARGDLPGHQLIEPHSYLATHAYDVPQHPLPAPAAELLNLVPPSVRRPLSVGVASGAVEVAAFPDAERIVAVPIDEITAAVARRRGLEVLAPRLDAIQAAAPPDGFDAVLLHRTLHHFPDPAALLDLLRKVTSPAGQLLVDLPNSTQRRLRRLARRNYAGPTPTGDFDADGMHDPTVGFLRDLGQRAGIDWRLFPAGLAGRLPGERLGAIASRWLSRDLYALGTFRDR
jgi:SAM-dependent methyltransferase